MANTVFFETKFSLVSMRNQSKKSTKMSNKSGFLYWAPRVLCIIAILFVSMFALDSFAPDMTLKQQILGFLIHLVPSYIMTALLVIAWKWEFTGGIIFIVIGIAFCISVFLLNFNRNHFSALQSLINSLLVAFPFVIVGILFILNSKKRRGRFKLL